MYKLRMNDIRNKEIVVYVKDLGYGLLYSDKILFDNTFLCIDDFNDDLTHKEDKSLDIIRVFMIKSVSSYKIDIGLNNLCLIWDRTDWINNDYTNETVYVYNNNQWIERYLIKYDNNSSFPFMVSRLSVEQLKEIDSYNINNFIESYEDAFLMS